MECRKVPRFPCNPLNQSELTHFYWKKVETTQKSRNKSFKKYMLHTCYIGIPKVTRLPCPTCNDDPPSSISHKLLFIKRTFPLLDQSNLASHSIMQCNPRITRKERERETKFPGNSVKGLNPTWWWWPLPAHVSSGERWASTSSLLMAGMWGLTILLY